MHNLKSKIFTGQVMHERLSPLSYLFNYSVYMILLDLAELNEIHAKSPLFKYNKFAPYSIRDIDYIQPLNKPLKDKLFELLGDDGKNVTSIKLLTSPRFFGYVFNPVSFYLCYNSADKIELIVVEINNTFSERHVYILKELSSNCLQDGISCSYPKEFYVSPFNKVEGVYEYLFKLKDNRLQVDINITSSGKTLFKSRIAGKLTNFTNKALLTKISKDFWTPWLNLPRIVWQAAKLYYHKSLPVREKPIPAHELTFVTSNPTLIQQLAMNSGIKFFSKIKSGELTVILPNGDTKSFGDSTSLLKGTIVVHDYKFFTKCLMHGDIGFGESFSEGLWDTPDLTSLIILLIENEYALEEQPSVISYLGKMRSYFNHIRRKNSLKGSKNNIKAHYDLSNEMFQLFLDPTMMYSCAIYRSQKESLEDAQINKINTIIDKLELKATDHLLEIGSGWGGFAIEAVKKTGCTVTTITLSAEQKALAEKKISLLGLSDKITVKLTDYRELKGSFDKIVSIEMIEAVGQKYLPIYFGTIDRLLKRDGLALIQSITIPEQRYDRYAKSVDWIQKHIFPGSHIPSLATIMESVGSGSKLVLCHTENIGLHYAKTLREWRERFNLAKDELSSHGFGLEFQRAWNYYFSYCEAGFATMALNNLQLLLSKPNNKSLINKVL